MIVISPLYSQEGEITIDTVKGNYYFSEGLKFFQEGNAIQAEENLLEALNHNPSHIEALTYITNLYYYTDKFSLASEYALRVINQYKKKGLIFDEDYIDMLKIRGVSFTFLSQYNEAVTVLSEFIRDFKTEDLVTAEIHHSRAICLKELGEYEKAYGDIILAHQLNDTDTGIQFTMGEILFYLDEYKKAIEVLSAVNQKGTLDPTNSYYFIGIAYFNIGDSEQCVENHLKFLNNYSDEYHTKTSEVTAKYCISHSYYNLNQHKKALQYASEIIDIYHLHLDNEYFRKHLLFMYGALLVLNGQNEEGKTSIKKAQILYPNEGTYYQTLGYIYLLENNFEEAIPNLTKAYDLGATIRDSVVHYQELYDSFLTIEDSSYALKCIDIIISLDKNNPANYRKRFDQYALDHNKNYNKMLNDLDYLSVLYAENKEKSAYFIATKAIVLNSVMKHEEALKVIDEAIRLDPFYEYFVFRSIIKISILLNENKEIEIESQSDVLKDIDKALTSNLRKQEIYMIKIIALMIFDSSDDACKTAKEAIKLDLIIDKELLNYICKGKVAKRYNERELIFGLSTLNERYADDSGW